MKGQEIEVTTMLEIDDIQRALQPVLAGATFDSISSDSEGFLDAASDEPDLSFVASKKTLTHVWAVQVYVYDHGHQRQVVVVALGEGVLAPWGRGRELRNRTSLSKSLRVAEEAARAICPVRPPVVLPDTPTLLRDDPAPGGATMPVTPPSDGKIDYVRRRA